jgi:hypothetical protein
MKLVAIRAPFSQKAPLPPAAMFVASLFGFDATAVHLAFARERVLAYAALPNLF